jgi:hypothetical protein
VSWPAFFLLAKIRKFENELIFGGFAKFSTFGFECVAKDMEW